MGNFADLIVAYAWTKDRARKRDIRDRIWDWYGDEWTVLVGDLCGFSRRAQGRDGTLEFLAVIRRMQTAAQPIIWSHDGEIVKMEADNCFAVFEDPEDAARAALELVAASNSIQQSEKVDLEMCCGLEHGEILYLKEHERDFFGEAVNVASRLGEDIANKDEILVGPALRGILEGGGWKVGALRRKGAPRGSGRLTTGPQ